MYHTVDNIPVETIKGNILIKIPFKELNGLRCNYLKDIIKTNLAANQDSNLILSFENVTKINNEALAGIVHYWRACNKYNIRLILCNIAPAIASTFKKGGLDTFVVLAKDLKDAILLAEDFSDAKKYFYQNSNALEAVFGNLFEQDSNKPEEPERIYSINRFMSSSTKTLPHEAKSYKMHIETAIDTEKSFKTKIVIVDIDEKFCNTMSDVIIKEGFQVICFNNSMSVLEYIDKNSVDIIISDIHLPQLNGYELCATAKQKYKTLHFIFTHQKIDIKSKIVAYNAGADEFLFKPVNTSEFIARLKALDSKIKSLKFLYYQNRKLEKLVITDPLTGLYNRRYFQEQMEKELDRAERYEKNLALIILDIDFFKTINDKYGHSTGDEVLKRTATLLKSTTRQSDVPCRIGGEEFVIILPEIDGEKAFIAAEKIRKMFEKTAFIIENTKITITVSLGISVKTDNIKINQQELFDMADKALYLAKNDGRNKTMIYHLPKACNKLKNNAFEPLKYVKS